jgi:hypothetical protein
MVTSSFASLGAALSSGPTCSLERQWWPSSVAANNAHRVVQQGVSVGSFRRVVVVQSCAQEAFAAAGLFDCSRCFT